MGSSGDKCECRGKRPSPSKKAHKSRDARTKKRKSPAFRATARASGASYSSFSLALCPRFLARPLFLPFHGLFRRLRIRMEAFLQDADCLAHRVSIKLLLSGRPWRQEQDITAILCLLRVAKRVCLSSYSIRRDDLQEHQARLRDNKLHSRLWNRRKHSNSQLSKMFTLGLGIPKVGMPIGRVPTRWRLRFDHVSSYQGLSKTRRST